MTPNEQLTYQDHFDKVYHDAQPPQVQQLMDMPTDGQDAATLQAQRDAKALVAAGLAAKGFLIDPVIMVYGWDAYWAMDYRSLWGFNQNYLNTKVPIKFSTDVADFPPFVVPSPEAAPVSAVGADLGGGDFGFNPKAGVTLTDGQEYTGDPRGTFIFHHAHTPFGDVSFFTKK